MVVSGFEDPPFFMIWRESPLLLVLLLLLLLLLFLLLLLVKFMLQFETHNLFILQAQHIAHDLTPLP